MAPTLGDSTITMDDYTEFVLDTFRRNVAFFSRENAAHRNSGDLG